MGKKKSRQKRGQQQRERELQARAELAPADGVGGPTGERVTDLLRLAPGSGDLDAIDPRSTPGFDGDKAAGKSALQGLGGPLADLQERLFAQGRTGEEHNVLLILQGMDTSGKGGVIRKAVGLIDPQGVRITSFKAPTAEERRHDFLWRIRRALPGPGMVGVFDRSHYEDVLIARVRELTTRSAITRRYDAINRFEEELAESGTTVLKCMLHISPEEQRERLLARLEDPAKHWKYNPGDVDERAVWPAYREAYQVALEQCGTAATPWHVVPSDRKWYRNWAIAAMLQETLQSLDPQWPTADFDVEEEKERVAQS